MMNYFSKKISCSLSIVSDEFTTDIIIKNKSIEGLQKFHKTILKNHSKLEKVVEKIP